MIRVSSSIEVSRPAEPVFAFLADAENNPKWQRGMQSCRWTTEPPIGVGSVYEQHARFLGRDIVSTFEVVAFEDPPEPTTAGPGRSISIRTIQSTFPIAVTRSVEPLTDDRCRVSADVRGDASGVFRIAAPLLRQMVQRSVRGDYRRLKELLESRGTFDGIEPDDLAG